MDAYFPARPPTEPSASIQTLRSAIPSDPGPSTSIPEGRPIELLSLVAIVALADVAIYDGGGAGLAAFFVGVPVLLVAASRTRRLGARLLVVTLLCLAVAAQSIWAFTFRGIAAGMLLLVAFAITLRGATSFVPELVVSSIASALGSFAQLWSFGASAIRLTRPSRLARVRWLAFFVPLGLVVLFGAVFAAANPVVHRWVGAAIAHLPSLAWFPSPLRFLFWGACALAAAGLLRPVCRALPSLEARLGDDATSFAPDGASVTHLSIARNVMLAMNALFLVYNALDVVYLWAGHTPEGVSHTDYAHGGAAWLTVALVLSTIVLGAIFRGRLRHDPRARLAYDLSYVWAAQNFVLAAGTLRRIQMYVAYSGLTDLRIFGIFGTALSTAGLAIIVVAVARRRSMLWVVRRTLDAFVVAVALYVVTPTDLLALRYNVARIQADQYRPLLHLFQQPIANGTEPELLPLLDHPDPIVREGVAELLAQRSEWASVPEPPAGWTSWQASRAHARAILVAAKPRIVAARPADPTPGAAVAKLRGVAYGINDEVEREGDEGPFDWRRTRYPSRY
jgi:hypothetical protein